MDNLVYKIAFASLKGISIVTGQQLLAQIGSEENFFNATESQICAVLGAKNRIAVASYRNDILNRAKAEAAYIASQNVKALYFTDEDYPQRLLSCDDAPLMLFTFGKCDLNRQRIISIVGTRHATPYGICFVNDLLKSLSQQIDNLLVVSGLAYGIDIAAHRASVANSIPTAAVFGHGLSTVYPSQHRNDAATMIRNGGMVITEYFHDAEIHRGNFLARNRIVAGMCDCLLVVESADRGGALVTAKIAAGYGRDVFALPGRVSDKYSAGCNRLIHNNLAALIQTPDDIIDAMGWTRLPSEGAQQSIQFSLSPEEEAVVNLLHERGEARVNEISIATNLPISRLSALLVDLEFKEIIIRFPGGMYRPAKA